MKTCANCKKNHSSEPEKRIWCTEFNKEYKEFDACKHHEGVA